VCACPSWLSINADVEGEGLARVLALGQAGVLSAARVALDPLRLAHRVHPGRGDDGQGIERVTHRLPDQFNAVERPHGREYMRGVGALAAADAQELALTTPQQEAIEQQRLGRPIAQATAELGEDGAVEAGVGQLQPRHVLPVDACAQGMGRLEVREAFGELQDRDEGQPPGGEGRLPMRGEERGEELIAE
jgi:hypothetical protein